VLWYVPPVAIDLMPGEEVIWEGHPSWRAVVSLLAKGILGSLLLIALVIVANNLGLDGSIVFWGVVIGLVGIGLTVAVGWFKRVFTTYTITDRRINILTGVLAKREASTSLDRIQNITITQGAIDRVFGTGTVDFDTASQDFSDRFQFFGIDGPREVRERIVRAQEARFGRGPAESPV
jgi:uncharacterized membrane protein YdbT with pleckstrin-like domain